ncbi:MAG: glycosyltransferase family 4 protein [Candidatus Abyssobacteria bacterium SURF_17]|uniref:Glycosyltransferase family 4 protein n=1 Tax=Candidatus Abyssobacteria bacterium SURF_17 TaxID=2093361 RepID=A0A419EWF6_9BACT|nr:MAG: glycosyltransferase family 4 protein [Candidatus Abyssubacteria bacterium SURF_17]
MNILMMTNTFTPHVGGVARSIEGFTVGFRRRGHRVMVVAPEFESMPEEETDVIRIPAIQRFNGSDFSVALRMPGSASEAIERFKPEIVHSHHPFLVGGAAVRVANRLKLPLVFTHHTMYEHYTHYVMENSEALKKFVVNLSTNYANLCDMVFAPSESVADLIRERGVTAPVEVVPTGVRLERFAKGSGPGFRAVMDIPEDAFVVGHVSRLAPEKNIEFLTEAVAAFCKVDARAHFLVVGSGPSEKDIRKIFSRHKLADRLHLAGTLNHPVLVSAYRAMDVFAFASKSETQGMVLTEAMATGVPVVALDASGVREVVADGRNGRLLSDETIETFSSTLQWIASLPADRREEVSRQAEETAKAFSMERSADKALAHYEALLTKQPIRRDEPYESWTGVMRRIKAEWELLTSVVDAASASLREPEEDKT